MAKYRKWKDIEDFDKFKIDFLLNYKDLLHIRFLGKTNFGIGVEDSLPRKYKLSKNLNDKDREEFEEDMKKLEKQINDKSEELGELIYNLLHAEGIKIIEKYKKIVNKYKNL